MSDYLLTTPYEEKMDKNIPHGYYPRPSLRRDSYLCLNGEWDFEINDSSYKAEYKEKILVPFPPESKLSGIERIVGENEYMHYKKSFTLPEGFNKGRVILHFGAVDTVCEVRLGDTVLGRHEGGYLPFSFDITKALSGGENTLYVDVKDGIDKRYPYGKQTYKRGGMWYTPVSGIWQTVWLESVPENYIEALKITPDISSVLIEVKGGENKKRITLKDSGETFEFEGESIRIYPKTVKNWTPETPYLYEFTIECGSDTVESYFALRRVEICDTGSKKAVLLNGKSYLFNALLDQGYYPDGIFMPATVDGYKDDIIMAKSLGFNTLRKHIKIEPEIFYYLCDKEGVAVFQDMVNNSDYSFFRDTVLPTVGLQKLKDARLHTDPVSRKQFLYDMLETADHLYNFPSVLYYTIFNEGWGQFDADAAYDLLKFAEPTRIIDSTSGWFRRHKSDVDSRHIYFKKLKLKKPSGDPVCISEFGGYSHRVDGHVFGKDNYGYRLFATQKEFEDAFVALYENEVAPLIKEGAFAFVYTQVSDVEDETNGLITYDRRVLKVDPARVKAVMDKIFVNN